jgi:hypothetical protein
VKGKTYRKRGSMQGRRGRRWRKPEELQLKEWALSVFEGSNCKEDISNDNLVGNWSDENGLKEPSEMYVASNRKHHSLLQQFKAKSSMC